MAWSLATVFGALTSPFAYISGACDMCMEVLSDRIVLAIVFFLIGVASLLIVEILFVLVQMRDTVQPPPATQRSVIKLPEVLRNRLGMQSLKQKEDCIWLNFLSHFLFTELRDSIAVRRFLTKKIQKEFEEVLTSRTGVFMDELFLRDYNLGDKFPVFMGVSVDKCDVKDDIIETLDIRARLTYDGGFHICIDADLPFGRTANISVKLLKLKGFIRIRFTNIPFSYWSFSFYEEPEIELDVSAQLDGRPVLKLKNVISHQIRKIIRKKHMLPMYKIRYKPFFQPVPESLLSMPENLQISGVPVASGILEVTVMGASNLPIINKGSQLYCTLSTDALPWKEMMTQARLKRPILTKELVKNLPDPSLGLILKDDLVSDRLHPVVIVEQVLVGSPAHHSDIKKGDIIVTVNGNKVNSAKQATKFLKSNKDRLTIQVESSIEEDISQKSTSDDVIDFQPQDDKDLRKESIPNDGEGQTSVEEDETVSAPSDANDSQKLNTRKTKLKPSAANLAWEQKFVFAVNPSMAYLNICVWSHGGDRSSRSDIVGSSSHDVLVGHVNLNLDDIYLHCLLTLSGKLYDKVKLKHGHHQTEAELAKEWSSHKGWNPELMYGDLNLAFHFVPSLITDKQRRNLTHMNTVHEGEPTDKSNESRTGTEVKSSPRKGTHTNENSASPVHDSSNYTQGHHQFDSTSFITATFCDYCGKKIWMKEAFKCRTCNMVCHKKCLVKCLVNTFCTEEGVKKRTALDEMWEPLTVSNRSRAGTHFDNIDGQDGNVSDRDTSGTHRDTTVDTTNQSENVPPTDETRSPSRFRNLKDRTERIKDNVVRSIRKTKSPTTLNDKMIMDAKEVGIQLFSNMEPSQRRDKLDELITQLDEQLKLEMKTKEELELELDSCSSSDPGGRRKSDVKSLENKINKSTDRLNAMRLLMLQYCTALQVCIRDPDLTDDFDKLDASGPLSSQQSSKVSYMGGIVKRASSSVKEKMSSIRKDFGKKGSPKSTAESAGLETIKSKEEEGKNNSRIISSILEGLAPKTDKSQSQSETKKDSISMGTKEESKNSIRIPESSHFRSRSLVNESLLYGVKQDALPQPGSLPSKLSLPKIEIDSDDSGPFESDKENTELKDKEPRALVQSGTQICRSSSDSRLEINKMVSLNPDDILRYHGNSLPKVLVSEDENSESDDYFILDSSDDGMSDFSEEDERCRKASPNSVTGESTSEIFVTPEDVIRGSIKYCKTADSLHRKTTSVPKDREKNGSSINTNSENADQFDLSENNHSYMV